MSISTPEINSKNGKLEGCYTIFCDSQLLLHGTVQNINIRKKTLNEGKQLLLMGWISNSFDERNVLSFYFDGGTFDVSSLIFKERILEVKAVAD
ncbi:11064_t:CDS:2 [Funneliformis mosseae]|uniref:11064_t:CDS:1 n=1 Tax=Funneliformis mosseae TaxID=27381 RepID=A0A9N9B639_FUNMO|nr:11064_t:CDS:2 [Funneliformis mosseae]